MKKVFVFSLGIFTLALLAVLILALPQVTTQAQDEAPPVPTFDFNDPEAIRAERERIDRLMAEHAEYVAQQDITDYHIVYFTEPETSINHDLIQTVVTAIVVFSWEDVLRLDAARPIQALIIHESARDAVDDAWVRNAYQNRAVAIAGINTDNNTMADLTGDNCIDRSEPPVFEPDFYYLRRIQVTADLEAERLRHIQHMLNVCDLDILPDVNPAYEGQVQGSRQGSRYALNEVEDYNRLASSLFASLARQISGG